jgi:hypothetical protein
MAKIGMARIAARDDFPEISASSKWRAIKFPSPSRALNQFGRGSRLDQLISAVNLAPAIQRRLTSRKLLRPQRLLVRLVPLGTGRTYLIR